MKNIRSFEEFINESYYAISEGKDAVKIVYQVLGNKYETIMHNTTEKDAVKRLGEIIVGGWQLVSTEIVKESAITEANKKFRGKTVKDLLKVAGVTLGGHSFLVQDIDGHEWAVFPDMDTKNTDIEIYGMDQYDNEKNVKIADISLVYEGRLFVLDEKLNFILKAAKSGDPFEPYGKPFFVVTKDADLVVKKMNDLGIRTFTNEYGDEYEVGLETYPGRSGKLIGINQSILQKALDVLDQRKDKITSFGWFSLTESAINEKATSEYKPAKFLVLPAVNPETQEPDDKIDAYMRAELGKSTSYYKPGIRSANPPKKGDEVDRNLEESVNENKIELALDKIEKWMPEDSGIQQQYYAIKDSGTIQDMEEFLDMHADEEALGQLGIKYKDMAKLAAAAMNESSLNEWTDFRFSGAATKKEAKKPNAAGMRLFKKYFPTGLKSQKDASISLDKHDASGIKQRMGQHAPMFVHVQYHEFDDGDTSYRVHQTQFYNSNFKDQDIDFNPRVTALALTDITNDVKHGTILVKTDEYIKDIETLRKKGQLGKKQS